RRAAGQIAAVALAAHTAAGFTGQGGAAAHAVQGTPVDALDLGLLDHLVALHEHLAAERIEYILGRHAAQHSFTQGRDNLPAVDHGPHGEAALAAAVLLDDDGILRHVHQTTGQVAGVGGLQ